MLCTDVILNIDSRLFIDDRISLHKALDVPFSCVECPPLNLKLPHKGCVILPISATKRYLLTGGDPLVQQLQHQNENQEWSDVHIWWD